MLISPPFLPPRVATMTDAQYLAMAMKEHDTGIYPVSRLRIWHGGSHLIAPPRGAAPIPDPQRISTRSFNCIDTGGHYCGKRQFLRRADEGIGTLSSDAVTQLINPKEVDSLPRRRAQTARCHSVID